MQPPLAAGAVPGSAASSTRFAASLQSSGLTEEDFRDPFRSTNSQQWSVNAASGVGSDRSVSKDANMSSLHRHAVSNASFDFGFTDPSLPAVPAHHSQYSQYSQPNPFQQFTPNVIRPQPIVADKSSSFNTGPTEGSFPNSQAPTAIPTSLSSPPFHPGQDQFVSNPYFSEHPGPPLFKSYTNGSQYPQQNLLRSRSSSVQTTHNNNSSHSRPSNILPSSSGPSQHSFQGSNGFSNNNNNNNLNNLARKVSSSSTTLSFSQQQRLSIASNNTASTFPSSATAPAASAAPYSHNHTRLNSTSSRYSRSSTSSESMPSHSKNSGSFYVRELKRRSATLWCDIPSSVWGLPIGVVDTSRVTITASNSNGHGHHFFTSATGSSGFPNGKGKGDVNSVDIRHSHLTPRLLASEVGDDVDDYAYSASNPASGRGSVSTTIGIPLSTATNAASSTLQASNDNDNDNDEYAIGRANSSRFTGRRGSNTKTGVDIMRYASVTSEASGKSRMSNFSSLSNISSSAKDYDEDYNGIYSGNTGALGDSASINSVEDGVGKIRLFAMNPDSSSSEDEDETRVMNESDSD